MAVLCAVALAALALGRSAPTGQFVLLALELGGAEAERYHVRFSCGSRGTMTHAGDGFWSLRLGEDEPELTLSLGEPDTLFDRAIGTAQDARHLHAAAPYWPAELRERLVRRRASGRATVVFDAEWFLEALRTSAFDQPLLFPNAASKLGLDGLVVAADVVQRTAISLRAGRCDVSDNAFAEVLLRVVRSERAALSVTEVLGRADSPEMSRGTTLRWGGAGRLIGEYISGELAQIGEDIPDGCRKVLGTGQLRVTFSPTEPLGLSLGPLQPASESFDECGDGAGLSVGLGAEVGEVDVGGAAKRAGVQPGMIFNRFESPHLLLSNDGSPILDFETILDELDARRARNETLHVVFDTAAPIKRLYAVEMPARECVSALAITEGREQVAGPEVDLDLDPGAAIEKLCVDGSILWREDTPRLFLGEAGSLTCAHTDICPQLEFAHQLCGVKFLGVASHAATPGLAAAHREASDDCLEAGPQADVMATRIPVHRPLDMDIEVALLQEEDLAVVALQPGDLAVFHSGALHFATNGLDYPRTGGLSGALYHGAVTRAVFPRLRDAAAVEKRVVQNTRATNREDDGKWAEGKYLLPSELVDLLTTRDEFKSVPEDSA